MEWHKYFWSFKIYGSPVSREGLVSFVKRHSQKLFRCHSWNSPPPLQLPSIHLIWSYVNSLFHLHTSDGCFFFFFLRFQGLICLFSYPQLCRLMIICPLGECKQLPVSSSTDTGGGISLWSMKTVYCWVGWGKKYPPTTVPQPSERWFHGSVSHQVLHVKKNLTVWLFWWNIFTVKHEQLTELSKYIKF